MTRHPLVFMAVCIFVTSLLFFYGVFRAHAPENSRDVTFLCEDGDLLSFGKDITEREIVEKNARLCQ